MTAYEVSLDKKRRLMLPPELITESGLGTAKDLVAYTDGAGRVVFAARSTLLPHVQGVFRAARQDTTSDPLDSLRAARASDADLEASRLARAGSKRNPRVGNNGSEGSDSRAVRKWAREQGLTVSPKGRIPASVLAQYQAAKH